MMVCFLYFLALVLKEHRDLRAQLAPKVQRDLRVPRATLALRGQ